MLTRLLRIAPPPLAIALAAGSGLLYSIGFCGFDQFYLAWICFVPLFWALNREGIGRRDAMLLAWTTGLVAHLGCYTWIIYMLRMFAYLPWPLALLGYFLLCLAQSALFGVWGWVLHWLVQRRSIALVWAAAPSLMLAEWIYPAIFPSYLANSQYRQIYIVQIVDIVGPLGLSGLLTLSSGVAYQWVSRFTARRQGPLLVPTLVWTVLFALTLLYSYGRINDLDDTIAHGDGKITVGVVQTNMGIYQKSENPEEGLRRHRDQSLEVEAQGAQLVVWPESGYFYALYDDTRNVKNEVMGKLRTPVLFGGLRVSRSAEGRQLFNTAFLADKDGTLLGSYDKIFLLMFGEYLPLGEWLPWLYKLSPQTSHFTRGSRPTPLNLHGVRLGALICYEDILPNFVRRLMREQPDVLVNMTNDAWFGRTQEPLIHLALASMRAVEQRRYLVRATNTGISAIIDPLGRIVAQTPVMTRANLVGDVVPLKEITIYQRLGDWVAWTALAWVVWCGRGVIRARFIRWRAGRGS